jgi:hypothetical protein
MPDLDLLMAEWPPELEAALANTKLPAANLVSILCTLRPAVGAQHTLCACMHVYCCKITSGLCEAVQVCPSFRVTGAAHRLRPRSRVLLG